MVIGLFDCGGGPVGCSDWLSVCSAVVVCPGGVRIVYIRSALTRSSSLDAVPVIGSLTLLCVALPYIVLLDFVCGCCLAVMIASGLLDEDYFSGKLVWIWLWRQIVLQRWKAGLASCLVLSWSFPGTPRRLWLTSIQMVWWTWERSRTLLAWLVSGRVLQYVGF